MKSAIYEHYGPPARAVDALTQVHEGRANGKVVITMPAEAAA
jgi:hypothetical protein